MLNLVYHKTFFYFYILSGCGCFLVVWLSSEMGTREYKGTSQLVTKTTNLTGLYGEKPCSALYADKC